MPDSGTGNQFTSELFSGSIFEITNSTEPSSPYLWIAFEICAGCYRCNNGIAFSAQQQLRLIYTWWTRLEWEIPEAAIIEVLKKFRRDLFVMFNQVLENGKNTSINMLTRGGGMSR